MRDIPDAESEVCLNLWYFVDQTGVTIRLAAKAYALRGDEDQKLATLHALAGTDHLTAVHGKVSQDHALTIDGQRFRGAIPHSVIHEHVDELFAPLIDEVERTLPVPLRSFNGEYRRVEMKIPPSPLMVVTAVVEGEDGSLTAKVGMPAPQD